MSGKDARRFLLASILAWILLICCFVLVYLSLIGVHCHCYSFGQGSKSCVHQRSDVAHWLTIYSTPQYSSTSWCVLCFLPWKHPPNHYHCLILIYLFLLIRSCKYITIRVENRKYGLLIPQNIFPLQLCWYS